MKTPMQELIERLNNVKPQDFCSIETIKGWAEELLKKEKEVMDKIYKDSTVQFNISSVMDEYKPFEKYYNETFNTKEK